MLQTITQWTSLPNLHPALVHFPIALSVVAWLFDLVALLLPRRRSFLGAAAAGLWLLASAGAGLAYWAGREAADSLVGITPQVEARISSHADWATYTLWALALLAAARVALAVWGEIKTSLLAIAVLLGLGGVVLVAYTGDLGGGLVYDSGVAVKLGTAGGSEAPSPETREIEVPPEAEAPADPRDRLELSEEGLLTWLPQPADGGALGTILQAAAGAGLDPVRVVPPEGTIERGLTLDLTGRTLLLLPGSFGDVEVAAVVELSGFRGSFGLAHHVKSATEAEAFTVEVPQGRFRLRKWNGTEAGAVHDEAEAEVPSGPLELAVTAIGRHLRGSLGGIVVVHGHEAAPPEGGVGLLLDGEGRVRILSVRVTPVSHTSHRSDGVSGERLAQAAGLYGHRSR